MEGRTQVQCAHASPGKWRGERSGWLASARAALPPSYQPASLDSDLSFIPEAVVAVAASARDGGGSGFPQLAGMAWSQDCSHGSCVQAVPAGSEYDPLQCHPRVLGALSEHLL